MTYKYGSIDVSRLSLIWKQGYRRFYNMTLDPFFSTIGIVETIVI